MVSSRICSTSEVNIGVSDNVRKLCATVPLKGPQAARCRSVWRHWWSPVDSANKSTCCWLSFIHLVVPSGTSDEIEQVGWFLEMNCHQFPCAAMEQPAPVGGGPRLFP